MSVRQDIVALPFSHFDHTDLEGMAMATHRNFKEVERMLAHLQLYMKLTGKPVTVLASEYVPKSILHGLDAEKPVLV